METCIRGNMAWNMCEYGTEYDINAASSKMDVPWLWMQCRTGFYIIHFVMILWGCDGYNCIDTVDVHCVQGYNLCTWPAVGFVNRSSHKLYATRFVQWSLGKKPIAKPGWYEQDFLSKPFP